MTVPQDARNGARIPTAPATPAERAAYEALYARCWTKAVQHAMYLLVDHALAEDAAQGAFVRVWNNWSTVMPLSPERQWRYVERATRHLAIDELRHRQAHPGGRPLSLEAEGLDGNGSFAEHEHHFAGLRDEDPENDLLRVVVARETFAEMLAACEGNLLRKLELHLTAQGYPPKVAAAILKEIAERHPRYPLADHYRHATASSIKMRRLRQRAHLRDQEEEEDE